MSDKIERYNEIYVGLWSDIALRGSIHPNEPDSKVEQEAALLIRKLRQAIERLRRIVDDEQPPVEVHSLQDARKLNKDELAYLAWQFFQWGNGEDCPINVCHDFPCQYRRKMKAECEEKLKNGDLDEEGMKDQQEHGYYANSFCDEDGMGCWAEYYLWCYRNGYNSNNGKKKTK